MNNLTQTRPEQETPAATPKRADAKVVVVATALAVVVWAAAKAAGVDLEVRSGSGTTRSARLGDRDPVVVGAVAAALLRLLERRTSSGLRTWTIVAVVGVGRCRSSGRCRRPASERGLVLATMHLAVGAVVVGGLRPARVA